MRQKTMTPFSPEVDAHLRDYTIIVADRNDTVSVRVPRHAAELAGQAVHDYRRPTTAAASSRHTAARVDADLLGQIDEREHTARSLFRVWGEVNRARLEIANIWESCSKKFTA